MTFELKSQPFWDRFTFVVVFEKGIENVCIISLLVNSICVISHKV